MKVPLFPSQTLPMLFDELFPPHIRVIAEPGRYFVCEAFTLIANVFAKRKVGNKDEFLYYINEGVYQSFNCLFFDHVNLVPIVFGKKGRNELYSSTLFGPTCDSLDCIAKGVLIPELDVGDWLYWKNMGAYTLAASSSFNGFKARPSIFYIQSNIL